MKIGFNLLLWTTNLVEKNFHLLEQLKNTGYDGVEVPIFERKADHFQRINNVLNNIGLESTGIAVISDEERNPISENSSNRKNVEDFFKMGNRMLPCIK